MAEVDQPDIDSLIILAQQIHGTIEAIILEDSCSCPVCLGQLGQCENCDGLFLNGDEDETHEMDEYEEEEFYGSPIDVFHDTENCYKGGCFYCYMSEDKDDKEKEEMDEALKKKQDEMNDVLMKNVFEKEASITSRLSS
jgi:hypothetical protein